MSNGEAFSVLEMTKPGELKSGCKIHWDTTDLADGDIKNGTVVTLMFAVSQDVEAGDICFVNVAAAQSEGQADVYDRNLEAVDVTPAQCDVNVVAHAFGQWATTAVATCTQAGSRERVCSTCNHKETESIAALGHSWDAGKVTKAATYDATGVRTFTCTRCKATRIETIPKLARTSLSSATISGLKSLAYTGKMLTPNPTVKVGTKTLKKGTDYTLSYKNNKVVGTATVTATGTGAYTGTKSATFKITKAANTAAAKSTSVSKTFKAAALKKAAQTIALPKVTTKFGTAKWTITTKDAKKVLSLSGSSVKVKKGTKAGTYAIKLKASVAGTKNYAAASTKVVTVKATVK